MHNTEKEGLAVTLLLTIRQVIIFKVGRYTVEISDNFGVLLVLLQENSEAITYLGNDCILTNISQIMILH
jgi:hypothetical protein